MSERRVELYPLWLRLWHWLNALLFLLLLGSGLALHFPDALAGILGFNDARVIHNTCGVALSGHYLIFVVATFLGGNRRHYLPRWRGLPGRIGRQTRFYAVGIFRGEPHPFPATVACKFNPLQQLTYIGVMFGLLPAVIVTGLLFLFPEYAPERIGGMGGLWPVAVAHYLVGLALTIFLVGHLYLATAGETLLGEVRKMIRGSTLSEESRS
ncbi:MAG: cytochrome b/b6 domain-containing protein [Magnetococcales bacterium]|nr:cytochrome b/b6 domain-containing protein [Magnetococcales bacterium]